MVPILQKSPLRKEIETSDIELHGIDTKAGGLSRIRGGR